MWPAGGLARLGRVAAPRSRSRRLAGSCVAIVSAIALTMAGCAFGQPDDRDELGAPRLTRPSPTGDGTGVIATVLARGLEVPWGISFLPDGAALVTERGSGAILRVGPGAGANGLTVTRVQTITQARPRGEGGLLGIAVSPTFATDQTVFVYYTTETDNRIARLRLGDEPVPIVTGIPAGTIHNGGQVAFGPDGFLYASTGDASVRSRAQDRTSLGGKILRMTTAGKAAPGNPYPGSLVFSYGHRNVQGLAWDKSGRLFATEFGQNTWDEINAIVPGRNYGWPVVEGVAGDPRFADPIQQWSPREASCSGLAISGPMLAAACLRGNRVWLLRLTASGAVIGAPEAALVGEFGRLRSAVAAPDGSIWVTTSNRDQTNNPRPGDDKLLRLIVPGAGGVGKS